MDSGNGATLARRGSNEESWEMRRAATQRRTTFRQDVPDNPERPSLSDHLPFSAVVLAPGAVLAPEPAPGGHDRARPGIRRLVAALKASGLRVSVLTDHAPGSAEGEDGERERLGGELAAALAQAGLGDLSLIDATDLVASEADSPSEALVVDAGRPAAEQVFRALAGASTSSVAEGGERDAAGNPGRGAESEGSVDGGAGAVSKGGYSPDGKPGLVAGGASAAGVGAFEAARRLVAGLDEEAVRGASERHLSLTKPPGSLGRLEGLGVQLAGIAGQVVPPLPRPATVTVFAADHGVHAQGVSPWPQEVTTQMVANFAAGGAAINVLAGQAGADVIVVDVGVAGDLPPATPKLLDRKVARGTADLSKGAAMTLDQARQALDIGAQVAFDQVSDGARCLLTGDMGIANTTASATLIVALGDCLATDITGRGAGLPESDVPRKAAIVGSAAARARGLHGEGNDALAVLAEVGGFEHAALAGYITAGAALGVPVLIDGVIAAAALLVASRLAPGVEASVIAGHRSVEPGSAVVLDLLGLEAVIDLDLRLGEGTGAALALPLVEAAARVLREMATFDQAGVSSKTP
jgi:nicotinate-nucleotide--dimethylbenzimidazole phosphoribosyltransferase